MDSPTPSHGMRFEVRCTNPDCYLFRLPIPYGDLLVAEGLAFVHEARWRNDAIEPHLCEVKELNEVQPSLKPATGERDRGAGNG